MSPQPHAYAFLGKYVTLSVAPSFGLVGACQSVPSRSRIGHDQRSALAEHWLAFGVFLSVHEIRIVIDSL